MLSLPHESEASAGRGYRRRISDGRVRRSAAAVERRRRLAPPARLRPRRHRARAGQARFASILRALRGATGPRDMAPLDGPMLAQPARAEPRPLNSRSRRAAAESMSTRTIYAACAGRSLRQPQAGCARCLEVARCERQWTRYRRRWRKLRRDDRQSRHSRGTRVIAVEPNPHVGWYLERTLRESGLSVEVVRKALTDRAGAIDIMIDRTWSGLSGVAADQSTHRGIGSNRSASMPRRFTHC